MEDGTEVYSTEEEVPSRDGPQLAGTTLPCNWDTGVRGYIVRSRLATQESWDEIDLGIYDDNQIRLKLMIGRADRGDSPNLEYWNTNSGSGACVAPDETTSG